MMSIDEVADIKQARRWFAEELRHTAHVRSPPVVEAFATVPREHFAGPGPWRVLSPLSGPDYWTTDDADPRHLCHDVLVAIDETRRLNNGQPSLWAARFDQLGLKPGDRVIHVGAGLGYYSAILAEIVGLSGEVTAIEIDSGLAERARANLARNWPQAKVIATDGFAFRADEPVDAIVVNAGVSHLALPWLDSLKGDGGRLLVPLTNANLYQSSESATRARDFRIGKGLIQGGERRRFAMAVPLRADFDAVGVRWWARKSKDGPQARRLLALAAIYEGASRTEAARIGGVTLQIVRDWVLKFNADGPAGLIDRKAPGQPPRLNDAHRATLAAIIESGPIPAVHGIVRWRIVDLCQWIFEEFRVVISRQTLSRELRAMGYRKLSARPRPHAQAAGAIEDFKKVSPIAWTRSHARTASLPRR